MKRGFSAKNFATAAGTSCCCGGGGGGCCCRWCCNPSARTISSRRSFIALEDAASAGDCVASGSGGFVSTAGGGSAAGGDVTGGSSWRGPASKVEYFFLKLAISYFLFLADASCSLSFLIGVQITIVGFLVEVGDFRCSSNRERLLILVETDAIKLRTVYLQKVL